jgi:hypothetical protein
MNNLECVIRVLESHREARRWADEAVAHDLLAQLDLDPTGEAKKAAPIVSPDITEAEVLAHEAAAKEATDKARAAREALNAQSEAEDEAKVEVAADQAKAAKDAREATKEREAEKEEEHPFVPAHVEPAPAFVPPVTHAEPAPMIQADPVPPLA